MNSLKIPRFFRISIEILIFVCMVVVTTFLLRPLQEAMRERMIALRDSLIQEAEGFIGRDIRYSSMGPSIFGTLDIKDLVIAGADAPLLSVSRLRLSWSPIRLLKGDPGLVQAISMDNPVIHLDTERDADILALFTNTNTSNVSFFDTGIRVKLRNGAATVSMSENSFQLDKLSFDVSLRGNRLVFRGDWSVRASLAAVSDTRDSASGAAPITFSMKNRVNGDSALDFRNATANLNVASLTSSVGSFASSLTINAMFGDNVVKLTKINDTAPFDLSADYELDSGHLVGTFRCENFVPVRLISLDGELEQFNRLLFINTSGFLFFENNAQAGLSYALSLSGALPTGFRLSDLNVSGTNSSGFDLVLGGSSFAIDGEGSMERIVFDSLSVNIPKATFPDSLLALQGRAEFKGSLGFKALEVEGNLALSDFSLSGTEKLAADVALRLHNDEITLDNGALRFGTTRFSGVSASARFTEQDVSLTLSMAQQENADARIAIDGFLDYAPQHLELSVALDTISPDMLLSIAAPFVSPPEIPSLPIQLERILLSGDLFLTTDFTRFSWNAPQCAIDITDKGRLFSGSLYGVDQRVEMANSSINLLGQTIMTSGTVDFTDIDDVSFSLAAVLRDTPYSLEGTLLDLKSLSIRGSYGLNVSLSMPSPGSYSGYITMDNLPVFLNEQQYTRISLTTSGRYTGPDSWSLDLERFEVADIPTPTSEASSLSLTGKADQIGAFFTNLFFDDGRGALNGAINVSWNRDFSTISGDLRLDNVNEQYELSGSFINQALMLRLDGTDMQLARFLPQSWGAVVSGSAELQWMAGTATAPETAPLSTAGNPSTYTASFIEKTSAYMKDSFTVDIDLRSLSATVSGTDLKLSADVSLNTDRLVIQNTQARYGGLLVEVPLIQAERGEGRAEGSITARMEDSLNMDIACDLDIDFKPIPSWFELEEALNSFDGLLSVDTFNVDSFQIEEPFTFSFSRNHSLISLRGGPRDMIRLRFSDNGDFYAALSSPSPVRGSLIGSLKDKRIEAQVPDLYVDLPALWRLLPSIVTDIIDIPGGFLTASVEISGPMADPEFFGIAEGNSVRLMIPQFLSHTVRPVPIRLLIDGNEMRFDPIPAGVGSGQGMVSAWFRIDRWIPNVFNLNIQVPAETPIPVDFELMGIIASGYASGNLNLAMTEDMVFNATGDLVAQDTDITINAEKLVALQLDAPASANDRIVTNFTIRSGRKVLFIWPNKDFPILQAYAGLGDTIRIENDSISRRFSLVGDINLRSGEIFYFQRSFYIREGLLSFNENEVQFEPRISARAELRDQSSEGMVTISMIIDESPLKSFTARFASNPPLSQMEILSYLGQSFIGDSTQTATGSEFSQSRLLASTTDLFAQSWVVRDIERWVRDVLFLDMFSFRTQILQNAASQLMGQNQGNTVSGGTSSSGGAALGFGNYLDNTNVFVGKYLDPNMFLQAMVSLRYDENRTAAAQGRLTLGGYAVEADIGFELRAPWMDVRLSIVPIHFERLFVDDISVSLIWRRSFYGLKDLFNSGG
ncbi:MAG: translocation/assembly module TamB domain-containing protein [Treponema sp.]|jgi:hypothetical protein|nr:translocation/assembly module TamB domain-containing protein [Treponema sp.]